MLDAYLIVSRLPDPLLLPVENQPSNNSLEGDAAKPRTSS